MAEALSSLMLKGTSNYPIPSLSELHNSGALRGLKGGLVGQDGTITKRKIIDNIFGDPNEPEDGDFPNGDKLAMLRGTFAHRLASIITPVGRRIRFSSKDKLFHFMYTGLSYPDDKRTQCLFSELRLYDDGESLMKYWAWVLNRRHPEAEKDFERIQKAMANYFSVYSRLGPHVKAIEKPFVFRAKTPVVTAQSGGIFDQLLQFEKPGIRKRGEPKELRTQAVDLKGTFNPRDPLMKVQLGIQFVGLVADEYPEPSVSIYDMNKAAFYFLESNDMTPLLRGILFTALAYQTPDGIPKARDKKKQKIPPVPEGMRMLNFDFAQMNTAPRISAEAEYYRERAKEAFMQFAENSRWRGKQYDEVDDVFQDIY